MDKNELYEKVEQGFNQAFEATKQSIKIVSEKAGEAAHVTKLLIERATLEHRVSKKFAEIGSLVYEKTAKKGEPLDVEEENIKNLLQQTKDLDQELLRVETNLEQERKGKKTQEKSSETEVKS